jgi:hypothetical protein
MGMFAFTLSIIAILISGAALGIQLTSADFDPSRCSITHSGFPQTATTKSCDEICGQNICIAGLEILTDTISLDGQIPFTKSNSNLVSCNTQTTLGDLTGPVQSDGSFESGSKTLYCICCG